MRDEVSGYFRIPHNEEHCDRHGSLSIGKREAMMEWVCWYDGETKNAYRKLKIDGGTF
jgi:hypothetical protein